MTKRSGRDGNTQLDPVQEMLSLLVYHKPLPFVAVLMESWYATRDLMLHIEKPGKRYDCPLLEFRWVDDSNGTHPDQRIDAFMWTETELYSQKRLHGGGVSGSNRGNALKSRGFPKTTR